MTAFTRFCTLSHFNLDLVGADKVSGSHTKSTRSHLFDSRTPIKSIRSDSKTFKTLTTFTGIGFAVDHIHGNSQCLMSFLRNGAIGHGTCLEALHNLIHTLYFFNRNTAFFIKLELQKTSQVHQACFFINIVRILFKHLIISAFCGFLKQMNGSCIIKMFLFAASHLMTADAVQRQIHIQPQRIKCTHMPCIHIALNVF